MPVPIVSPVVTLHDRAEDLPLLKLSHLLLNSTFETLSFAGKSVMFIGATGVGKSTAMAVMLGAHGVLERKEGSTRRAFKLVVPAGTTVTRTSSGFDSTTINMTALTDGDEISWIDTAGLVDTRGRLEQLWVRSSFDIALSSAERMAGFVIMLNFNDIPFSRNCMSKWQELADGLMSVLSMTGALESVVFLVNADIRDSMEGEGRDRGAYFRDNAIKDIKRAMSGDDGFVQWSKSRCLAELETYVPEFKPKGLAKGLSFDKAMGKLSEQQHAAMTVHLRSAELAKALDDAATNGRVVIGMPFSNELSKAMRTELKDALDRAQVMDRQTLATALRGGGHVHSFSAAIDSLAGKVTTMIERYNSAAEEFIRVGASSADKASRAKVDWEGFRRELVREKEDAISSDKDKKKKLEAQNNSFRASEKLVIGKVEDVLMDAWTRWWPTSWFGNAYATKKVTIELKQAIVEERLGRGKDCVNKYKVHDSTRRSDGNLVVTLESKKGKNLDVAVELLVKEKDHPHTAETIKENTTMISGLCENIKEGKRQLEALKGAKSPMELLDAIDANLVKAREAYNGVVAEFDEEIEGTRTSIAPEVPGATLEDLRGKLNSFATIIKKFRSFGDAYPSETLLRFIVASDKMTRLAARADIYSRTYGASKGPKPTGKNFGNSEIVLATPTVVDTARETVGAVVDKVGSMCSGIPSLRPSGGKAESLTLGEGFAMAISGVVLMMAMYRGLSMLATTLALLLVAVGSKAVVDRIAKALSRRVDSASTWIAEEFVDVKKSTGKSSEETIAILQEFFQKIADRFNIDVDVKVDLKDIKMKNPTFGVVNTGAQIAL